LGQKYLKAVLSDKKPINTDVVYGIYFSDEGTMLGETFHLEQKQYNDIIVGKRYDGTWFVPNNFYEISERKYP